MQNKFDHNMIQLSVVVQEMVLPQVSGILFTADPVSGNRKVVSIDASFGLGEALVSGLVNADNYKVSDGKIIDKKIAAKKLAIYGVKGGGTKQQAVSSADENVAVLSNEQVLRLSALGRDIEKHFGVPQDIEWCLVDDIFHIVQSRPITTLYPVPDAGDNESHVYVSVGHQQMMTDPMRPLGLSFYQMTTYAPMRPAAGRLFVDVTPMLNSPARQMIIETLGKSDPLIKDALVTIVDKGELIKPLPATASNGSTPSPLSAIENNPAIATELIRKNQLSLENLKRDIQSRSGVELLDFIVADTGELKKLLSDPQSMGLILGTMDAASWINDKMKEWLGEVNAVDMIAQSAPNNITSEMGLALMDIADVIRPFPSIVEYLQNVDSTFDLDDLDDIMGGAETKEAILSFLEKYGMRCVGEIDVTRTRWSENPTTLIPMILNNLRNFEPGASKRKFNQGLMEALKKENDLLDRLKLLPDGEQKVSETKHMIDLVRNFSGYREYPKYGMINRYFVYKQALLKEAETLVTAKVIEDREDIFYLSFDELRSVVETKQLDRSLIHERKEAYRLYEKLTPPRVITSDGEIVSGRYRREKLPANAIVGLPVSSGVVEGRARVILSIDDADLEPGDILVTSFTDPSWTPLFVSIKGLVAEVGGLMTHGAVIAREYGLPAVVGVENATKLIKDGQRIRLHGTDGYLEIL